MRCITCKKGRSEAELYEGIREAEMVIICEPCSQKEGVPLIRKPTESQLEQADERYSVRERMEYMSGMRAKRTQVSNEQLQLQGNLARLRIPDKKETHPEVLDNYYWSVNMARRRKKMTPNQLANHIQMDLDLLKSIEQGKIPENFEEVFLKLESFLGVQLLKNRPKEIAFTRNNRDYEKEILEVVRKKMGGEELSDEDLDIEAFEAEPEVSKEDVTLSYLIDRKRKRDQVETDNRKKIQTESLLGDDLELDE